MNPGSAILARLSRASSADRNWALNQLTPAEREALQRLLQPGKFDKVEKPVRPVSGERSALDLPALAARLMSEPLWFQQAAVCVLDEPARSTVLQWLSHKSGRFVAAANTKSDSIVLTASMAHAVTELLQSASLVSGDVALPEKRTLSRFDRLVRRFQGDAA
jgi:hypothetical protein